MKDYVPIKLYKSKIISLFLYHYQGAMQNMTSNMKLMAL